LVVEDSDVRAGDDVTEGLVVLDRLELVFVKLELLDEVLIKVDDSVWSRQAKKVVG
jgi:hypothetical protein